MSEDIKKWFWSTENQENLKSTNIDILKSERILRKIGFLLLTPADIVKIYNDMFKIVSMQCQLKTIPIIFKVHAYKNRLKYRLGYPSVSADLNTPLEPVPLKIKSQEEFLMYLSLKHPTKIITTGEKYEYIVN